MERREGPQECFSFCQSDFHLLLSFSVSYIHEMTFSSITPPFFSFLEMKWGMEERKDGNSYCISLYCAVVEIGFGGK